MLPMMNSTYAYGNNELFCMLLPTTELYADERVWEKDIKINQNIDGGTWAGGKGGWLSTLALENHHTDPSPVIALCKINLLFQKLM